MALINKKVWIMPLAWANNNVKYFWLEVRTQEKLNSIIKMAEWGKYNNFLIMKNKKRKKILLLIN